MKEETCNTSETAMTANPLLAPVELTSRWFQILGNKRNEIPENIRRDRWEQWKILAHNDGRADSFGKEMVEYWTDTSECHDCKHRDIDWCQLQGLPCTVNPILTFNEGIIGMACMGLGKEIKEPTQLSLW